MIKPSQFALLGALAAALLLPLPGAGASAGAGAAPPGAAARRLSRSPRPDADAGVPHRRLQPADAAPMLEVSLADYFLYNTEAYLAGLGVSASQSAGLLAYGVGKAGEVTTSWDDLTVSGTDGEWVPSPALVGPAYASGVAVAAGAAAVAFGAGSFVQVQALPAGAVTWVERAVINASLLLPGATEAPSEWLFRDAMDADEADGGVLAASDAGPLPPLPAPAGRPFIVTALAMCGEDRLFVRGAFSDDGGGAFVSALLLLGTEASPAAAACGDGAAADSAPACVPDETSLSSNASAPYLYGRAWVRQQFWISAGDNFGRGLACLGSRLAISSPDSNVVTVFAEAAAPVDLSSNSSSGSADGETVASAALFAGLSPLGLNVTSPSWWSMQDVGEAPFWLAISRAELLATAVDTNEAANMRGGDLTTGGWGFGWSIALTPSHLFVGAPGAGAFVSYNNSARPDLIGGPSTLPGTGALYVFDLPSAEVAAAATAAQISPNGGGSDSNRFLRTAAVAAAFEAAPVVGDSLAPATAYSLVCRAAGSAIGGGLGSAVAAAVSPLSEQVVALAGAPTVNSVLVIELGAVDRVCALTGSLEGFRMTAERDVGTSVSFRDELGYFGSPSAVNLEIAPTAVPGRLYVKAWCFANRAIVYPFSASEPELRSCGACPAGTSQHGGDRISLGVSCYACSASSSPPANAAWLPGAGCVWSCTAGFVGPSCAPCGGSAAQQLPANAAWLPGSALVNISVASPQCVWACSAGYALNASAAVSPPGFPIFGVGLRLAGSGSLSLEVALATACEPLPPVPPPAPAAPALAPPFANSSALFLCFGAPPPAFAGDCAVTALRLWRSQWLPADGSGGTETANASAPGAWSAAVDVWQALNGSAASGAAGPSGGALVPLPTLVQFSAGNGGPIVFTDALLPRATLFQYFLTASNCAGDSVPGFPLLAATLPDVPSAPLLLALGSAPGPASALLAWQPPADTGGSPETSYMLYAVALAPGAVAAPPWPWAGLPSLLTVTAAAPALSALLAPLAPTTEYAVRITASSMAGEGAPSALLLLNSAPPLPCPGLPDPIALASPALGRGNCSGHGRCVVDAGNCICESGWSPPGCQFLAGALMGATLQVSGPAAALALERAQPGGGPGGAAPSVAGAGFVALFGAAFAQQLGALLGGSGLVAPAGAAPLPQQLAAVDGSRVLLLDAALLPGLGSAFSAPLPAPSPAPQSSASASAPASPSAAPSAVAVRFLLLLSPAEAALRLAALQALLSSGVPALALGAPPPLPANGVAGDPLEPAAAIVSALQALAAAGAPPLAGMGVHELTLLVDANGLTAPAASSSASAVPSASRLASPSHLASPSRSNTPSASASPSASITPSNGPGPGGAGLALPASAFATITLAVPACGALVSCTACGDAGPACGWCQGAGVCALGGPLFPAPWASAANLSSCMPQALAPASASPTPWATASPSPSSSVSASGSHSHVPAASAVAPTPSASASASASAALSASVPAWWAWAASPQWFGVGGSAAQSQCPVECAALSAAGCSACAQRDDCGWCEQEQACVRAADFAHGAACLEAVAAGPTGTPLLQSWARCPAARCPLRPADRRCLGDAFCGLCAAAPDNVASPAPRCAAGDSFDLLPVALVASPGSGGSVGGAPQQVVVAPCTGTASSAWGSEGPSGAAYFFRPPTPLVPGLVLRPLASAAGSCSFLPSDPATCGACLAKPGCGYCAATGKCGRAANASAPSALTLQPALGACAGQWLTSPYDCSAVDALRPPTARESCIAAATCSACLGLVAQSGCAFCDAPATEAGVVLPGCMRLGSALAAFGATSVANQQCKAAANVHGLSQLLRPSPSPGASAGSGGAALITATYPFTFPNSNDDPDSTGSGLASLSLPSGAVVGCAVTCIGAVPQITAPSGSLHFGSVGQAPGGVPLLYGLGAAEKGSCVWTISPLNLDPAESNSSAAALGESGALSATAEASLFPLVTLLLSSWDLAPGDSLSIYDGISIRPPALLLQVQGSSLAGKAATSTQSATASLEPVVAPLSITGTTGFLQVVLHIGAGGGQGFTLSFAGAQRPASASTNPLLSFVVYTVGSFLVSACVCAAGRMGVVGALRWQRRRGLVRRPPPDETIRQAQVRAQRSGRGAPKFVIHSFPAFVFDAATVARSPLRLSAPGEDAVVLAGDVDVGKAAAAAVVVDVSAIEPAPATPATPATAATPEGSAPAPALAPALASTPASLPAPAPPAPASEEERQRQRRRSVRQQEAAALPSCAICLSAFEQGEAVRVLLCRHGFHAPCIDQSLLLNKLCPMCRRDSIEMYAERLSVIEAGLPDPLLLGAGVRRAEDSGDEAGPGGEGGEDDAVAIGAAAAERSLALARLGLTLGRGNGSVPRTALATSFAPRMAPGAASADPFLRHTHADAEGDVFTFEQGEALRAAAAAHMHALQATTMGRLRAQALAAATGSSTGTGRLSRPTPAAAAASAAADGAGTGDAALDGDAEAVVAHANPLARSRASAASAARSLSQSLESAPQQRLLELGGGRSVLLPPHLQGQLLLIERQRHVSELAQLQQQERARQRQAAAAEELRLLQLQLLALHPRQRAEAAATAAAISASFARRAAVPLPDEHEEGETDGEDDGSDEERDDEDDEEFETSSPLYAQQQPLPADAASAAAAVDPTAAALTLVEMGFESAAVARALRRSGGNADAAAHILLTEGEPAASALSSAQASVSGEGGLAREGSWGRAFFGPARV